MKASTPKPFDFGHFTVARRIWTGVPQWSQVVAWQRAGLVSAMLVETKASDPNSKPYAEVVLTDKGREELGREA